MSIFTFLSLHRQYLYSYYKKFLKKKLIHNHFGWKRMAYMTKYYRFLFTIQSTLINATKTHYAFFIFTKTRYKLRSFCSNCKCHRKTKYLGLQGIKSKKKKIKSYNASQIWWVTVPSSVSELTMNLGSIRFIKSGLSLETIQWQIV